MSKASGLVPLTTLAAALARAAMHMTAAGGLVGSVGAVDREIPHRVRALLAPTRAPYRPSALLAPARDIGPP